MTLINGTQRRLSTQGETILAHVIELVNRIRQVVETVSRECPENRTPLDPIFALIGCLPDLALFLRRAQVSPVEVTGLFRYLAQNWSDLFLVSTSGSSPMLRAVIEFGSMYCSYAVTLASEDQLLAQAELLSWSTPSTNSQGGPVPSPAFVTPLTVNDIDALRAYWSDFEREIKSLSVKLSRKETA